MRIKVMFSFLAALSLVAGVFAQQRGAGGAEAPASSDCQKWAVIIGVGDYEDPGLSDLPNTVRDATAVRDALLGVAGGFDPGNVVLMTPDASEPMHRPTRSKILGILSQWVGLTGPQDTLLVYFAGHGMEDGDRLYLMPQDAITADVANTGLSYSLFESKLDEATAKCKVVILDACHSGAGRGAATMTPGMMRDIERYSEGKITLASCQQSEVSHEYDREEHGAFTWFLLDGLRGSADENKDSLIGALELSRYVFEQTRRWAAQKALRQTPRLLADISGDVILARAGTMPTPVPAPPQTSAATDAAAITQIVSVITPTYVRVRDSLERGVDWKLMEGSFNDFMDGTELDMIQRAADLGVPQGQVLLAFCYLAPHPSLTLDEDKAGGLLLEAVKGGDSLAELGLGMAYSEGWGVPVDSARCRQWLEKARGKGSTFASIMLALEYWDSDPARAVEYVREAADRGNALAMAMLGSCYRDGFQVRKDKAEADRLYQRAEAMGLDIRELLDEH
ncbi:MAG: caspase family protein [Candidatus Hydrogenedentes bacterium]|nr:caspase family protein [Candidatus Hydrogenedentota bacterium]